MLEQKGKTAKEALNTLGKGVFACSRVFQTKHGTAVFNLSEYTPHSRGSPRIGAGRCCRAATSRPRDHENLCLQPFGRSRVNQNIFILYFLPPGPRSLLCLLRESRDWCSICSITKEKLGLLSIMRLSTRYVSFRACECAVRGLGPPLEDAGGAGVVAAVVLQVTDLSVSDCTKRFVDRTWDCRGTPRQDSFSIVSLSASVVETWIAPGVLAETEPCT
ncbi:hypothetical protein EDD21DRAFT_121008 [Dissophora ornata]|nr:hypothetical protein EDD21DRAFT_121008 [Dissophora ornata]